MHPLIDAERSEEAELVASLASDALAIGPEHTVAILVRTRSQAGDIFDALRARSLAYESIDMDLVGERAVVRDLISLCLALRYPHDRLHWLSLLRAPFVGLTLKDLHMLMDESGREATVIELLRDPARLALLSHDGQTRAGRLLPIIEPALKRASRGRLLPWVESVWLQLGGPVVCRDAVDRDAAERALARLSLLEADGRLWEKSVLTEVMKSLYAANAEEGDCRIQVMTLHKAKGLEFGTVILPALDRQPRGDSTQLLNWFESTLDGRAQLLLAPLEQSGVPYARRDRINRLVRKARERCDEQEKLRLLYVACTRARNYLHLIARIRRNPLGQYQTPMNSSLLKPLWPLLESELTTADTHETPKLSDPVPDTHEQLALQIDPDPMTAQPPLLERLTIDVKMPTFTSFQWEKVAKKQEVDDDSVKFLWAGRTARDIGTVVHQQLQMLAQGGDSLETVDVGALATIAERQLRNMGVQKELLPQATETVLLAVQSTLTDERGRWAIGPHSEARSEWALSVVESDFQAAGEPDEFMGVWNREVRKVVIDRTFVDADGVRWIVDFKTGDHQGGQVEMFLDSEQMRYADQLNRYADIIRRIDGRPIRVGLYFPLLKGWREWEPPVSRFEREH